MSQQSPQVKVAVIHYSATGNVHALAEAIARGAEGVGAQVRLRKVRELAPREAIESNQGWSDHAAATSDLPEAGNDDLTWADAVVLGSPTRYGLVSAQLKQFIDGTGGLWAEGLLADKIYSGFTSASTNHGGNESTLTALMNVFAHWGGISVPPGYTDAVKFADGNPYGTTYVSSDRSRPDETALASATYQGRRVATVAAQLVAGRAALAG